MSQARCNARRRKQAVNNMAHLPVRKRPNYCKAHTLNVQEAITAARQHAAKMQRISAGKKK